MGNHRLDQDRRLLTRVHQQLPLRFEPNLGQTDAEVRFLSRGSGYSLLLAEEEAVLSLTRPAAGRPRHRTAGPEEGTQSVTIGMRPVGASPNARLIPGERQSGKTHYLTADKPVSWHTDVPGYGRVTYAGVYPGVDLVYRGARGRLEYDFVLAPGADPKRITLAVRGADRLTIARGGDLVLETTAGKVRQRRPFVYQRIGKRKRRIHGHYVIEGRNRFGFSLGAYDRSKPLVIDPVLAYSSYLGGTGGDSGRDIAVDSSGDIYVIGTTSSIDFPREGALQEANAGGDSDVFVAKLDASRPALAYTTYLGGGGIDQGLGIAVDLAGNAYVTGRTNSGGVQCGGTTIGCTVPTEFPTVNPIHGFGGGGDQGGDAFAAKLNDSGSALVYSTYLGGVRDEIGYAIAVEPDCARDCGAYLTGVTTSPNFPTESPVQSRLGGRQDAFVAKLENSGSALAYSTYLGGSDSEGATGIAVDSSGAAYLTGETNSPDFPLASPAQEAKASGLLAFDAFVSKVSSSGSSLSYSTYLGGAGAERSHAIAVDESGAAYVTGQTSSVDFPTANPMQRERAGSTGNDAFVTKLDASGSSLSYSTYLGGSAHDAGHGIAVSSGGSAYVTGTTNSGDFPNENPVYDTPGAGFDAFVSSFDASDPRLAHSTYLGGGGFDQGYAITVDATGSAYVTGATDSADFPMAAPAQRSSGGDTDAFVARLSPAADLSLVKTDSPDPAVAGQPLTYTLTVHNAGPEPVAGLALRDRLPAGATFVSASPGCAHAAGLVTCGLGELAAGASVQRQLVVRPALPDPALSNTATVVSSVADPDTSNDSASAATEVRRPPADEAGGGGNPSGLGGGLIGADRTSDIGRPQPPVDQALALETVRRLALRGCFRRAASRHPRPSRRRRARMHRQERLRRRARGRCLARHGRIPGRISGLRARGVAPTRVALSFRAAGTDRNRPPAARSYLLKQSPRPIRSKRSFRRARALCNGSCRFAVTRVGTKVTLTITGLRPRTAYHYAIAARDNVSGRLGPRSRTVRVRTR